MILYPAIDMLDGQAVRLRQGKRDDVTVYGDPVALARQWRGQGAQWLHLVDLTAAFEGETRHLPLIREVVEAFGGPVELGGGLRTMTDIDLRMEAGVTRVIIGTAAAENPALVEEACRKYPGRVAVGIDAKDGLVATRGWVATAGMTAIELALRMRALGVTTVIYTDVSRDGMMQGPNVSATRALIEATGLEIIGSGGVSAVGDLLAFREAGCAGAILGKALYEKAFTLADALSAVE
ncbi:MAG: 1-(5-phosphoribosyl)-5-[(5-phosphoribosylamino)methylideneamino]imidazole-4-carboxamide isomerase [Christensenellaceae bacterium]|nr:1-(5-phosphoribosyl)-5-[(5-phosphoribosylamino)methylideneamino]imidazole-4-carboxamide isomerase [Christensenellaceae bacterium]